MRMRSGVCSSPEHGNVTFDPVDSPSEAGKTRKIKPTKPNATAKSPAGGTDLRALGK
jgi:hypothetical protein